MRRTQVASLSMFNESRRWMPGTRCQAKYKKHFYNATIVRYIGNPGCQFRVEFDDYSICANVRASDLRQRPDISTLSSSPEHSESENKPPVRNSSRHRDEISVQKKRCWQPPGGNPKQIGHVTRVNRVAPESNVY